MKKFLVVIFIISTILLIPHRIAFANNYNSFDVISVSNNSYSFRITIYNTFDGSHTDIHVGTPLNKLNIIPNREYNGRFVTGDIVWENPEYVIVEGDQIVKAIFNCNETQEKVELSIYIKGISKEKTPAIGEKKLVILGVNEQTKPFNVIQGSDFLDDLPKIDAIDASTLKPVDGKFTYINYDNMRLGKWNLEWTFIPDDPSYESVSGTIPLNVRTLEEATGKSDETSLTASNVLLATSTSYDINLNNKPDNASYKWTSSNEKVAKVSKNGVVTAVSNGEATITCVITESNGEVKKLTSKVSVGVDDNFPVLNEEELLLDIDETFNLKAENTAKGSTIKWKSSDKTIAKVSSGSGKVTALKKGKVIITCTITQKDKSVIVLKCDVEVE